MPDTKQYADRDHMAQGPYYLRHVSAMTGEGLHAKSAIAGELAHRDMVIDAQAAEIERLRALHAQACDMYDRKNPSGCVCKIDPVTDEVASACALHREMAEDAARWREISKRFDNARTSRAWMVLEGLGFGDGDPTQPLSTEVDKVR